MLETQSISIYKHVFTFPASKEPRSKNVPFDLASMIVFYIVKQLYLFCYTDKQLIQLNQKVYL